MERHRGVNLTGELNKASVKFKFPRLPGQIKRIDRNAVSPQAGPGIERHESERLCFCCFNNLPDIDPHRAVDELQLIYQSNIHAAEDVLQELSGFGDPTRCNRHNRPNRLTIDLDCLVQTSWRQPTDKLWNFTDLAGRICWVFPFGRES